MTVIRTTSLIVFECKDRSCAPPPVGTGGSRPSGSSGGPRANSVKKALRVGAKTLRKVREKILDKYPDAYTAYKKGGMDADSRDAMEEIDAVEWYVRNGYESINSVLRRNVVDERITSKAKAIDRAFDRFGVTLEEPVTVLRGVQVPAEALKEGSEFVDRGFISTTGNRSIADRFASEFGRKVGVVMRISVPAGRKVLVGQGSEDELILPRGSRFRVIRKLPSTGLGRPAEVEVALL